MAASCGRGRKHASLVAGEGDPVRGEDGESAEWRAVLLAAVEAVAQADTVGLALSDEAHGAAGAPPA